MAKAEGGPISARFQGTSGRLAMTARAFPTARQISPSGTRPGLQGEGLLWLTLTPEGLDQLSAEIADPAGRMPRTDEMQPGGGYPRLSRSRALRHAVRFRRRM